MTTLLIKLDGRTLRFDETRLVRIGRSIDADVLLTAASVSRAHAELRPVGGAWMLVDAGSQFGTFVGGDRVREHRVTGPIVVQCGPDALGSSFSVVPEAEPGAGSDVGPSPASVGPAAAPPVSPPIAPPVVQPHPAARPVPPPSPVWPAELQHTQVFSAPRSTQGLPYARSGPDLLVVAQGREHRVRHPAQLRVGRLRECEIVIDDEVCSRVHGLVSAVPGGWVYTDQSTEGSFEEGRRVTSRHFEDRLDLRLGHPVAGPALSLVPILSAAEEERRFARRRRRRSLLVLAAVAVVLALVATTTTLAVMLTNDEPTRTAGSGSVGDGRSSSSTGATLEDLSTVELDLAKAATVLLVGEAVDDAGNDVQYSGSGSIISNDGLILTNAHVAQPSAEGLDVYYGDDGLQGDPEYLLVALVEGDDDAPAAPEYRARTVEVDGARDAAVMQIYATADGVDVDPATLDLPTVALGDSDDLDSGDDVTVLGFPGISGSTRLTVTKGVISTFIDREGLGPRSEIDTDTRIAPGNSGGAAIDNDARIIGIPSALFSEEGSPVVSGRIRPINLVLDLIEAAESP